MEIWHLMVAVGALGVGLVVAVASVSFWAGGINTDIKWLKDGIGRIEGKVDSILRRNPPRTLANASPITLSDLGREVSTELGVGRWAAETAQKVIGRLKGERTSYRIQEFSFAYVNQEFAPSASLEEQIEEIAYEHGVDRADVLPVFAIELRDALIHLASD